MAWASHEFALTLTDTGGTTLRESLEQVEKTTGKRPTDLDGPPFPHGCEHWWRWFLELSGTRGQGPAAITFAELQSWGMLTGKMLSPLDVFMIKQLDGAYLKTVESLTHGLSKP